MKIAVMGATGLLGHSVCQEVLARGHKLLAYSNRPWTEPKGRYETCPLSLHEFDLVIRELFDQWPDALINCAARNNFCLLHFQCQAQESLAMLTVLIPVLSF